MIAFIEILGWIVLIGITIGLAATLGFFIWIVCNADPDFKNEDDREIYEHKYWKKK